MTSEEDYKRQKAAAQTITEILESEGFVLFGTIVRREDLPVKLCPTCKGLGMLEDDGHAPVDQRHDEHPSPQPPNADVGR